MSNVDLTPLMRQYREIKQAYREAILFFRVGDFYEMFYEDAREASRLLSIALTSRDKASPDPVPLCGVPHHAATGYIAKLLKAGRTVALCDQVEDPKLAKGLVRREVVRLYTPGTLFDAELLPLIESNFLVALSIQSDPTVLTEPSEIAFGLAALDISTSEFWTTQFHGDHALSDLLDELSRCEPTEIVYPDSLLKDNPPWLQRIGGSRLRAQPADWFNFQKAAQLLQQQFGVGSLDGFGCAGLNLGVQAAGAVLRYVQHTQPSANLEYIRRLQVRRLGQEMHLDSVTIHNLELVRPMTASGNFSDREGTLLAILDHTVTAMGSRLLRDWIVRPLLYRDQIESRQDGVGELKEALSTRIAIRAALRGVQDIARLSSRISLGVATPRELLALKQSLAALPQLHIHLASLRASLLLDMTQSWDDGSDLQESIEQAVIVEAPISSRDGGIIKDGFHAGVDELRKACKEGKGWLAALETAERERTGIDSLKIRFNQVFGYYLEVSKSNLSRVPAHYMRKQTLVNAERFMTPELKDLEERVTDADIKLKALEQELFEQLRSRLAQHTPRLQRIAAALAFLDVMAALAEIAALNQYSRPRLSDDAVIHIINGRHPVVERLDIDGGFVPNDTLLDLESNRLLVLTGPNMAGKSTYLRQVALIVLMAQIGSFVPAEQAHIGLVDRIFTRVGASDNLVGGHSTFMMEMTETANILHSATQRSLILLDEVGRGTSTYDGLSIAWAVAEYIEDPRRLGARTLFATHYHEMTQLEKMRDGIKNYRVAVQEREGTALFLRKIVRGGADKSYGIYVARLAGLPPSVISRANEVLAQLEASGASTDGVPDEPLFQLDQSLPTPHPILDEVRQMDLFSMTPLDALNRLADLQRRLQ
ncbi:MAG: DNA mismatch repair protein MutS [Nitrospiraceae bacterium]